MLNIVAAEGTSKISRCGFWSGKVKMIYSDLDGDLVERFLHESVKRRLIPLMLSSNDI